VNLLIEKAVLSSAVCHPERSEGSDYTDVAVQILRFALDDKPFFFTASQDDK
jgi:hypothetical protein